MKTYVGSKVLVDDLNGNRKLLEENLEIKTEDIDDYMNNLGFYFLGEYDNELIYIKQDFNRLKTNTKVT